jgi:type IV pilus assembly protein PilO
MKFGPRERIIASVIAVVVVLVAMAVFLVWPQIQKMGELDAQISAARSDAATAQAQLETLKQSKARASDTDAAWLRLANLVPNGPDLPSLIVELQDAAFDSGVQLFTVTPSNPVGAAGYATIPIQVEIVGTWADTVDYIQRLPKFNRGLRVVESSTARVNNSEIETKENATVPNYSARTVIKLEAYTIPEQAATSTVPATAAPSTGL